MKLDASLGGKELKTWKKMLKSRCFMSIIDGGLAFVNPGSNIRKRIFIMLSILETSTNHTEKFFAVKRNFFYLFSIGFSLTVAAFKAFIGIILLKLNIC